MKNLVFNLRTAKAQAEGCAKVSRMAKVLTTLTLLLTLGVGQMWADTYYLRYMLNMPLKNYDGNTSLQMTQSSANSNRYYCTLNLTSGTPIGYFIRVNDSENSCWKADATKTKNQCHTLESYGGKHGNSPNRLTFTPTSTGDYIFTYDLSNHHICVSPAEEIIKIAYEKRSGSNDGDYNLGNYVDLKRDGETNNYYIDLDLEAVKYYMFVQVQSDTYYKVAQELTEGSSVSLFNYGTNNYGDSPDKINFTPGVAGKYRFTWNHNDKTITYKRLYTITPVAKYTNDGSDYTESTTGGTVTINGNSSATQVIKDATYEIVATPASGYCVEEIKVGDAVAWSQPIDYTRQTAAKTISTYRATAATNVTVKFAKLQDITLYIHDGGVGGLVLQNYQAKVGEHSVLSSNTTLTAASNGWYYHTFANVTNVSLLNVACANIGLAATVNGGQPIENFTLTQTAYFSAIKPRNTVLYSICDLISVSYSDQAYVKDAAPITLSPTYTLGYSASATYAWTVTSQPAGGAYTLSATNVASPTFSSSVPGTYTLQVQVTSDGCTKSTTFNIEVSSPEITAATFVQNPILTTDHLQVSISYHHIPAAGCYIRLKKKDGGYYNDEANQDFTAISEGSGSLTFTTYITNVPSGVWTVEIWNQAKNAVLHSMDVTGSLTVKTGHTITVTAGANGTVSPSTVYAGDEIRSADFTATPNIGYVFNGWTKTAGAENFILNNASSATTYVTTASSNGTVRADFVGASHTLTLQNAWHGSITSSPAGTARTGETVTINPTPDSGYEFDYIEVNGVSQGSGVTTFTMPGEDVTVTAHFKQGPTLGAVIATPSGQQNNGELPIDFALSVTSTYLAHPVVVFFVNDGTTTYEVVGTPYGAEGNSAAGTIGTGPAYTTVHKATFTASAAKTYTVSAKLYEGELIDNFEGENTRGWAGDNLGNGSMTFANNPGKMTVNGSNKVMQVTRTGGADWGGAIMLFVDKNAKATCDAAGSNDYAYIHARMKDATDATHLKNNDNTSDGNNGDINPSFVGATSSDWRHVTYRNTHCSNNFLFFMIQRGNTDDKTVYIDDIILSNEETMTEKATAAAPASFSINTVTLNNNDATTPGTESVIVTYGSALSNITVPTKTDYTFYGYYTENAGEGRQLINDAGEWIASVDGYTNENKKWVHDGNVTLYAYYKKAQITRITFSPGNIVAPGATVTVTATIEPAPAGETTICWRVLYSNDNPLAPQPKFTPAEAQGNSVSFKAPEASGSYKVEATLRKGTGCGGEEIHTFTAPFQVAGDHTVTVQYKCGDVTLQGSTSVSARPLDWSEDITPDEIFGYSFEKWVAGDGVTMTIDGGETTIETGGETTGKAGTHAIQIKAIYDGKLIAKYTKKNIIYFKNTLGWSEVYVNLYPYAWWNKDKGAGNHSLADDKRNKQMTQLGETDIWYYEYGNTATTAYVSFTDRSQNNYVGFAGKSGSDKVKVSYPTRPYATADEDANYGFNAGTPMFVPTAGQPAQPWNKSGNDDLAEYYNKGYWRKYDPIQGETGYTLKVYNKTADNGRTELKSIKFVESDVPGQLFKAVADLEAAGGYGIKFERDNSMLYTNQESQLHRTGDVVVTEKQDANYRAIWIKATAAGDYTFAITINGDGKLCIQAEFPVAENDYRVIYTDNDTWTKAHTPRTWIHPSRIITAEENAVDTISFFVSKGHSPEFKIQKVNTIDAGTGAIEWTDVTDWTSCDDVDASGVYNFIFTQDGSKNIRFTKKEPYTGNFYIRTDAAGSTKWDNYRAADHLMTYSEYSKDHSDYTHYFVKFVRKSTNVKFVVANDYSPCISDTLIQSTYRGSDASHVDAHGFLNNDLPGDGVNVRFMWDIRNNAVMRAYLAPAQSDGSNFLVLRGTDSDNLKDENGNPLRNASNSGQDGYNHKAPDYCIQFVDNENWIYEATVQVVPSSYVKLYAFFHGDNFYYKGTEDDRFDDTHAIKLVEGSGNAVKVRVIYDFKTDRLVAAYLPSGNIDEEMAINADVMFIREHQGDIEQLTFTGDGSITNIKTAYAVMRFNKWTLNNKEKTGSNTPLASPASIYERSLYYVSFPFPVNLNEVFGFGTYGQHWIIQRYRGDLRAQQGFWAESDGFWEFIWNRNGVVLQPNEGYILTLETELLGEESDVWGPDHRSNQIELFFPSTGNLGTITNSTVNCTIPEHSCTINRAETEGLLDSPDPSTSYNRTVFDSHWNIMSVPTYVNVDDPSFANTTWIGDEKGNVGPKFLYTWNMNDNTLTATSGKGFMYHAMHAYTVQYYGNVTWKTSVTPPAAPQRNTEYRGEYEFCLEVQQDDQMIDRTYVRLSDDENVTTGFEFSEDMTKQFNSRKANIFTIAGNTSLGGNSLPLSTTQTTVVPVGVKIKTAGDYTFSIPEGTEGIGVTLVDNETGVRTLLSALDYTVNLTAGTHDQRFWLEISPIYNTPTGIEEPTSDSSLKGRAQKRIIDGVLYIVKDGKIFDARGTRVE